MKALRFAQVVVWPALVLLFAACDSKSPTEPVASTATPTITATFTAGVPVTPTATSTP